MKAIRDRGLRISPEKESMIRKNAEKLTGNDLLFLFTRSCP